MKPRKIVLLSLIGVLLCIYIIQLATTGRGSVKEVTIGGDPTKIVIESPKNGTIILSKKDDAWYLGENQQYETLESEVKNLVDALAGYSVLQTVSSGGDEVLYGLDDDAKISVTAYQDDTILCQFDVGKDVASMRQSYIRMAGEKDILLVSESYNNVFSASSDDLRIRNVYWLDEDSISEAGLVSLQTGVIAFSRDAEGNWLASVDDLLEQNIEDWISTVSILNAVGWLPDDWQPSVEPVGFITLKTTDKVVTSAIYPVEGEDRYIASSTESPYYFYISSYTADKFLRTVEDFAQQN